MRARTMRHVLPHVLVCTILGCTSMRSDSSAKPEEVYQTALRIAQDPVDPSARTIAEDLGYSNIEDAYLLAFKSEFADGPVRLETPEVFILRGAPLLSESALVAVRHNLGSWRLVYAYRQLPRKESGAERWRSGVANDAPVIGSRDFDHKPSRDEIERFLADSCWKFGTPVGTLLLRGKVFSETWERVFGYRPSHDIPEADVADRRAGHSRPVLR